MGKKSSNVTPNSDAASKSDSIRFPTINKGRKPRKLIEPEVLIPNQVVVYPDALTAQECQEIISLFASSSSSDQGPLKLDPSPPARKGEAQRTNFRFSTVSPEYAKHLYEMTGIQEEIRSWKSMFAKENEKEEEMLQPVGLSSNIRVYRYRPGDIFGAHYDDHSTDPHFGPTFGKTEWTLLIYLTGEEDGVEGGQTVFYKTHSIPKKKTAENTTVAPLHRGSALFHRHGKVCMLHEALPPTKGDKWVLRSDVIFGKAPS